ncbi:MAG: membrane dipeptidase [Haliea sp.]|uniref:dipeptidase n=1 Tax=Marinobacter salarius TaxID=1420917 RepID=UPI0032EAFD42
MMPSATATNLLWDAHSNLPLEPGREVDDLLEHRRHGFGFVSINVGYDPAPLEEIMRSIAWFREAIDAQPGLTLVGTLDELEEAYRSGLLAVAFDLEGALCLLEEPSMVALWAHLGVRQMHLAYNRNNWAADGCYDKARGLTPAGRAMVQALNAAGIMVDCSHGGERSTLEIMAASSRPVVFSHACAAAIHPHPRNVSDRQIRACAESGGVIGIVGYSRFLGATPSRAEDMVRHMVHVAELVGAEHVGIGWDYGYPARKSDPMGAVADFDWWFPDASRNRQEGLTPEQVFTPLSEAQRLPHLLEDAGFSGAEIHCILRGNFERVARATWPGSCAS